MTGTSEPRGHRPPPAPGAIGRWLLLAVSTVVLYLGFHHNAWHVAHQPWFERHEQGAEGKVVGRMVRSRAEGVLSGGAQLCQVYLDRQRTGYSDEGTSNQYLAYLHQLPYTGTDVHRPQSGDQGLLCVQIGAVDGDLRDGTGHITTVLRKRTHADPATLPDVYRESLEAPLPDVLRVYLLATYYDLDRLRLQPPAEPDPLRIRYSHLLVAFTALSLALLTTRLWIADPGARRRRTALAAATTVALLGPASWFLIFQAHAAAHGHLDNLVWHLPYVFFGFAAGALVLRDLAVGAWLLARRLARRG